MVQSDRAGSGMTGSRSSGRGRNSLTRWSRPAVAMRAKSGPPSTTRAIDGVTRSVRSTSAVKNWKGASVMGPLRLSLSEIGCEGRLT